MTIFYTNSNNQSIEQFSSSMHQVTGSAKSPPPLNGKLTSTNKFLALFFHFVLQFYNARSFEKKPYILVPNIVRTMLKMREKISSIVWGDCILAKNKHPCSFESVDLCILSKWLCKDSKFRQYAAPSHCLIFRTFFGHSN